MSPSTQPWRSKRAGRWGEVRGHGNHSGNHGGNQGGDGGNPRLKPVTIDPLEEVGLPSKGDERILSKADKLHRLLSFKAQEDYYAKIYNRCQRLSDGQTSTRGGEDLVTAFSTLQIQQRQIGSKDAARDMVLMAMRKLREGIVASARADQFAVDAYSFIIRIAVSWASFEAYQPALLHLLHRIHAAHPLPRHELEEFVSYRVLDLACRLGEHGSAHAVRLEWSLKNPTVDTVLVALVRNDWRAFWKAKSSADEYQAHLMAYAEARIRQSAIQVLTKSYFTVDTSFVKACTGQDTSDLVREHALDWTVEGEKVTVRRVRAR